jgi:hypothetical protein
MDTIDFRNRIQLLVFAFGVPNIPWAVINRMCQIFARAPLINSFSLFFLHHSLAAVSDLCVIRTGVYVSVLVFCRHKC